MASTINGTSTGNGGLISTGDDSGILNIQTNETTAITVDASQNTTFAGKVTSAGALTLASNGTTTAITVDTSQNTILGSTSSLQSAKLSVYTTGTSVNKNQFINWTDNTNSTGYLTVRTGGVGFGSDGMLAFSTNQVGTVDAFNERMRIDSSGNLLVGTTSSLASGLTVTGGNGPQFSINTTTRYAQMNFYNSGTQKSFIAWDNTNTNLYVQNSSGGVYLTNTGTSWTSNSDERLKENLVPITDALTKVNTLRAVVGNFISDETKKKTPFLIAQDVKAVLPEAVTSSTLKNDETNTEYFGIAYTEVIPLLVASIKELKAINDTQAETINALTARIVALEGA